MPNFHWNCEFFPHIFNIFTSNFDMAKDSTSAQGSRALTNNRMGKRKKKGRRSETERGNFSI